MHRRLIIGVSTLLALAVLYPLSLGPLAWAYRHGHVSRETWMYLTVDPGPLRPVKRYLFDGRGTLADGLRWWQFKWDPVM